MKAIKERNYLTKVLLDSLPCVAILVSCETRIILAMNERAAKAGCEIGQTCYGTWSKINEPCSHCLAPDACATCENRHIILKEENNIWDVHWIPINKTLVVHYALDITDIVRAEEVLEKTGENIIFAIDGIENI